MLMLLAEAAPMRPAALVLLALFIGACLMLLPRELAFIRGAGKGWQARFIIQDAWIIACILTVLVPCTLADKLTMRMLYIVLAGFTFLWVAVVWAAGSRYGYVRHILHKAREETALRLVKSMQDSQHEGAAGGAAGDGEPAKEEDADA